jgi:hypothetical protein
MRFLLLLIACGEDINPAQQTMPDLTASEPDQAVMMDLSGPDLTQPPNGEMGSPDLATPAGDLSAARKRVFVTSGTWLGDLKTHGGGTDGLDGGNKLCQAAATTAGLGGTWVAWLSDSTHNAVDRVTDVGPWYRMDGMMVFANKAGLTGHPMVAINRTENNTVAAGLAAIPFTGTSDGGAKNAATCTDWTSDTGTGECGQATATNKNWTEFMALSCGVAYSLYCFEQ